MKNEILRSHNPVKLDMPSGTVRANAMTLYSDKNEIFFRGKVAVHLKPTKKKAVAPAAQPAAAAQ